MPNDRDGAGGLPLWVSILLIIVAASTYAVTQIAALTNPQVNTGYTGPVMLAVISLVAGYHVSIGRKNGDSK